MEPSFDSEVVWPGVSTAHSLVERFYDIMLERLDAFENRIQALQTLVVTFTLAVPIFSGGMAKSVNFASPMFIAALVVFILAVMCGVVGRAWGSVTLVNPKVVYEKWLHYSDWEFKKTALYWAGMHYEANVLLVNRKGYFLTVMSTLFAVEVLLLLFWLIDQI